jgi:hypothetical protein
MAGYIDWLRSQMENLIVSYKKEFFILRAKAAADNLHGRIPETIANLYLGAITLFSYMVHVGVISESQKEEELSKTWIIFTNLGENQGRAIVEDAPAEKFLSALEELITAQKVCVDEVDELLGSHGDTEHIGWQDDSYYYLLPGTTYKAVCQFYQQQGGAFGISEKMLWKHLESTGKIRTLKDSKNHTIRTVLKSIPALGRQIKLIWLKK